MTAEIKKTCPKCKTEFSCHPQNCWCRSLPKIMPLNVNEDCFCSDCLNKILKNKTQE